MHELPEQARTILIGLDASPRLLAHLTLVHDVAWTLLDGIARNWPDFQVDRAAVLFGAATHDAGKTIHPDEQRTTGRKHENDGPALLVERGVPEQLARFARTHGQWALEPVPSTEDLLVALANTIWIGIRNDRLEGLIVDRLEAASGEERWSVYARFDDILLEILEGVGERYALYTAIPDEDAESEA